MANAVTTPAIKTNVKNRTKAKPRSRSKIKALTSMPVLGQATIAATDPAARAAGR
jgi:hypothetical protein